jgi:hypothetical protein
MPKVNPRNEVGVIVHAVSKIVLGNHTAKNIYGNVNYAKTFMQSNVLNVFDGHVPGGREMLSPAPLPPQHTTIQKTMSNNIEGADIWGNSNNTASNGKARGGGRSSSSSGNKNDKPASGGGSGEGRGKESKQDHPPPAAAAYEDVINNKTSVMLIRSCSSTYR